MLELRAGDVDAFLTRLRSFFAAIPYDLNDQTERHHQVVFYLVFALMGQFVATEVKSAKGRADAVVWTSERIFVFEFKLQGTAEEALDQIGARGYYSATAPSATKPGVNGPAILTSVHAKRPRRAAAARSRQPARPACQRCSAVPIRTSTANPLGLEQPIVNPAVGLSPEPFRAVVREYGRARGG